MWKFIIFATFAVIWAVTASEGLDNEKLWKKGGGCNSAIYNRNNSGFHLGNVNGTLDCLWNITAADKKDITLFFFYLFLDEGDEITVYRNASSNGTITILEPLDPTIKASNGSVTLITGENFVQVRLTGKETSFIRQFEGFFSNDGSAAIPPGVTTVYSPLYVHNISEPSSINYRFNDIQHVQAVQVFNFEKFNVNQGSKVTITGSSLDGEYNHDSPVDLFNLADDKPLTVTVQMQVNSTDYFQLNAKEVDKRCSFFKEISGERSPDPLQSPVAIMDNGSIVNECRWVFKHKESKIFGLKFDKLDFKSVFDIVAINNGLGEFSEPLLQVTTSNRNASQSQVIRSSGSYIWISFKPLNYLSSFEANITIHGQGGYILNNGTIKMNPTVGNDTVFLLEVEEGKNVQLKFEDSSFSAPATLYVYDGFDESNLLTSLHGQIKFPVISKSSKMMVIGKAFSPPNSFIANFQGITPGCNQMSSHATENYVLSENCNSSCTWVIPPQDSPNSMLLLNLQYVSLNEKDVVKIHKLDANLTQLGVIMSNQSHVPHISVSSNVGLLVNVIQGVCKEKKDKLVLIGHSSYMPGCNYKVALKPSDKYQISSPLYPDTYPLFTNCQWNISVSAGSFIHMTFDNLRLADNHCVKVFHNSSKKYEYDGKILPKDDLFLIGDTVVEFDSTSCSKPQVGQMLSSDEGFLLNATVTDCGAILNGNKNGEFNTNVTGNTSICIWKVSVPPNEGSSVNIISYTMNQKDKLQNYMLKVYDGSSVRDQGIMNDTKSDIWSRTNTLIFVYTRLNISKPSGVLTFKYSTISCNTSMQCSNKMCMHPDWKCNGIDECGDNSDERNCASVPVPPEIKFTGYSATAFWFCVFAMLAIGIILGVTVPICYQKWRDSRYTRFRELSGIDG